ncbi:hypothetical protein LCM4573_17700 [Rhizobium sp. LCM 4573]|nr:hypothetical protein LCM4573_17700 [Rhizobium sp. LCM 4573]
MFLDKMHISLADASIVAQKFSDMAGYQLPLARASYWHSRKALRGGIFEDQEELPLAEFGKWCRSAAVSEVARKKGEQD